METPNVIEIIKNIPSYSEEIFWTGVAVAGLSAVAVPYIRYFTDYVDDNEIAMANWVKGFYGPVIRGPEVLFWKRPGAELIRKSTQPRIAESIHKTFTSETDPVRPGFKIVVKMDATLSLVKRALYGHEFIEYHRMEDALETALEVHLIQFIDTLIRDMSIEFYDQNEVEESDSGQKCAKHIISSQTKIQRKAEKEAGKFLKDRTGETVEIFQFATKLDLEEDVREAMEKAGKQRLTNFETQVLYEQVDSMFKGLLKDTKVPDQLALLVALKLAGEEVDLAKSILEFQGLDKFKGLGQIISGKSLEKAAEHVASIFKK